MDFIDNIFIAIYSKYSIDIFATSQKELRKESLREILTYTTDTHRRISELDDEKHSDIKPFKLTIKLQ